MADNDQEKVNPTHGDHDRVQMLSLKADGTPDQVNPEIIGDKDVAVRAAREQFAQQAVSAKDVEERGVTSGPVSLRGTGDNGETEEVNPADFDQDPSIQKLADAHEEAAKAAESAAENTVNDLHRGLGDTSGDAKVDKDKSRASQPGNPQDKR